VVVDVVEFFAAVVKLGFAWFSVSHLVGWHLEGGYVSTRPICGLKR
jgi:hypothetical protein